MLHLTDGYIFRQLWEWYLKFWVSFYDILSSVLKIMVVKIKTMHFINKFSLTAVIVSVYRRSICSLLALTGLISVSLEPMQREHNYIKGGGSAFALFLRFENLNDVCISEFKTRFYRVDQLDIWDFNHRIELSSCWKDCDRNGGICKFLRDLWSSSVASKST